MVGRLKNEIRSICLSPLKNLQKQDKTQVISLLYTRNLKVFKTLSEYLRSRTSRQCRSHFQKLMNRFKNLKKMIEHHQKQMGVAIFLEAHR